MSHGLLIPFFIGLIDESPLFMPFERAEKEILSGLERGYVVFCDAPDFLKPIVELFRQCFIAVLSDRKAAALLWSARRECPDGDVAVVAHCFSRHGKISRNVRPGREEMKRRPVVPYVE